MQCVEHPFQQWITKIVGITKILLVDVAVTGPPSSSTGIRKIQLRSWRFSSILKATNGGRPAGGGTAALGGRSVTRRAEASEDVPLEAPPVEEEVDQVHLRTDGQGSHISVVLARSRRRQPVLMSSAVTTRLLSKALPPGNMSRARDVAALQIRVRLTSGRSHTVVIKQSETVGSLRSFLQDTLQATFFHIITGNNRVLDNPFWSLQDYGVKNGDSALVVIERPRITSTSTLCAICNVARGFSKIVTWSQLSRLIASKCQAAPTETSTSLESAMVQKAFADLADAMEDPSASASQEPVVEGLGLGWE
eukprot:Skav230980  [mRNA]  locus=scaffold4:365336:369699:- [translate_table: standard]